MKVYVKRCRLKWWVKEVLITSLIVVTMVGLFSFASKENEDFINNCVNAGNSRYYCERNS